MQAARSIRAPVLLLHGADDHETVPAHSQRIYEALAGPRRLMLVPGVGHNGTLGAPGIWVEIDKWIEEFTEWEAWAATWGNRREPGWFRSARARRQKPGRMSLERAILLELERAQHRVRPRAAVGQAALPRLWQPPLAMVSDRGSEPELTRWRGAARPLPDAVLYRFA